MSVARPTSAEWMEADDDSNECHTCGGDGWVFTDDWEDEMWYQDDIMPCWNCHGTGKADDCWLW